MVFQILLAILVVVTLVQFMYYFFVFRQFSFAKLSGAKPQKLPVSVVVCAKNEAENVKKFVPLLLEQNYPNYEVVLIDDASSDDTRNLFKEYAKKFPDKVKYVRVDNNEAFWGNKKYALTLGIKAAKNEYLLFTDADCFPISKEWIAEMTAHFTSAKSIVLGYGSYRKIKNSLLNKLIRFETLLTAVQYFSWAKAGKPYMGVGRNMAYRKEDFFRVRGFIDHMKLRSGDDDLFINQAANSKNTAICFSEKSFTCSEPKTTYKSWFYQKRRHVSTARHYKIFDRFQLSTFYISQLLFIVLTTILLIAQFECFFVLILVGVRYLFAWASMGSSARKLREKDLVYWFPILEILLIFTQLNVFVVNAFSKPIHWK